MDGREKMSFTLKSLYDDPFYQFFLFFYFNWRWHIIFKYSIVDEADTYLKYFTTTPSIVEILTHIWILVLQNEAAVLIKNFEGHEEIYMQPLNNRNIKSLMGKCTDRRMDGRTSVLKTNHKFDEVSKVFCYYKYHNLILYIS